MNSIDKKKMLEGVLYNFHFRGKVSEAEMDALIQARDTLKKAGLIACPNQYRQLEIKRTVDMKLVCIGLHI